MRILNLFLLLSVILFRCGFLCYAEDYSTNPYSYKHDYRVMNEQDRLDALGSLPFLINDGVRRAPQNICKAIVDDEGNKSVYLNGQLMWREFTNGEKEIYQNNQKFKRFGRNGSLMRAFDWALAGSGAAGEVTIYNEFGAVLGYEKHSSRGVNERFDSRGNLTDRYEYGDDGKYWQYNLITDVVTSYKLGKPIDERRGKDGELLAYWQEDGDSLWRVPLSSVLVRDEQGRIASAENGLPQWQKGEGFRERYNKSGSKKLAVYDEDNLIESYSYVDGNLYRVENYLDNSYKLFGDYGIIEEGYMSKGKDFKAREHEWNGSRHIASYELQMTFGGGYERTGKETSYNPDGSEDETFWIVNEINKDWFDSCAYAEGVSLLNIGDKVLAEGYVMFDEIADLEVSELASFFHTSDKTAQHIYSVIEGLKKDGKVNAGLFAQAVYDLEKQDGVYLSKIIVFDEINSEHFTLMPIEAKYATAAARLLEAQARDYLEQGEYLAALRMCDEFESNCIDVLDGDFDNKLGRIYLKVLNIKKQALQKLERYEEASAVSVFISDNFSDS